MAIDKQQLKDLTIAMLFQKLKRYVDDGLEKLSKIFEEKLSNIQLQKGDDGHTPTPEELTALIKPLIPKVKDGENYILTAKDRKDIARQVEVPVVEKVIEKVVEKTEVIKEQPIVTNLVDENKIAEKVENDLPQLGERIRDGLELLQNEDRLNIEAIDKLREELDELKKQIDEKPSRIIGGQNRRGKVKSVNLSNLLDGSTKTFSIHKINTILSVHSTSSPLIFRPITDYTNTFNSITFTDEIEASTTLASGQSIMVVYEEY